MLPYFTFILLDFTVLSQFARIRLFAQIVELSITSPLLAIYVQSRSIPLFI